MYMIETPIGKLYAQISEKGIEKLSVYEFTSDNIDGCPITEHIFQELKRQLQEFFDGNRREFDLPLNPKGTDFQISVWKELLIIPYGKTLTYKEQAQKMNAEKAVRAVAAANGKNPVMIVIPCHRVIGRNGGLTGYAGGLELKEKLLNLERGQQSIF